MSEDGEHLVGVIDADANGNAFGAVVDDGYGDDDSCHHMIGTNDELVVVVVAAAAVVDVLDCDLPNGTNHSMFHLRRVDKTTMSAVNLVEFVVVYETVVVVFVHLHVVATETLFLANLDHSIESMEHSIDVHEDDDRHRMVRNGVNDDEPMVVCDDCYNGLASASNGMKVMMAH